MKKVHVISIVILVTLNIFMASKIYSNTNEFNGFYYISLTQNEKVQLVNKIIDGRNNILNKLLLTSENDDLLLTPTLKYYQKLSPNKVLWALDNYYQHKDLRNEPIMRVIEILFDLV